MQLVVFCNEEQRSELEQGGNDGGIDICYLNDPGEINHYPGADAYLDLLFENTAGRISVLHLVPVPVIVNSVIETLEKIDPSFTRINAWPGFLGTLIEGCGLSEKNKRITENVFRALNKSIEWVPDEPGFITPRVICMIINEAYFALEEKVSTKEEIDTAMKLGTAYPYGPFEWSKKIGLLNVYNLLCRLSEKEGRYEPAGLMKQEALALKV